jgi:hypothetical protein
MRWVIRAPSPACRGRRAPSTGDDSVFEDDGKDYAITPRSEQLGAALSAAARADVNTCLGPQAALRMSRRSGHTSMLSCG